MTSAIDALSTYTDDRRAAEVAAAILRAMQLAERHAHSSDTPAYDGALRDAARGLHDVLSDLQGEIEMIEDRADVEANGQGNGNPYGLSRTHPGAYGTEGDGR